MGKMGFRSRKYQDQEFCYLLNFMYSTNAKRNDLAHVSYNSSYTHYTKLSRQQASSLHGQQQLRGTAAPHSCL